MISIQNLGAAQPFQKINPYTVFPVRSFGKREPIQILPTLPVKTFNPLPVTRESDIQLHLRQYRDIVSRFYPMPVLHTF